MEKRKLKGPEKAAVFLLAMGEEVTAEIFKELSEAEIRKVIHHMSGMGRVPVKSVEEVMQEFQQEFISTGSLAITQDDLFLKKVLSKAIGDDKADSILINLRRSDTFAPFEGIKGIAPKTLADFIKNEHPQIIAFVLANLDYPQAARVLAELPDDQQTDIALRIATLDSVPPSVVEEVDKALQEELRNLGTPERHKTGGAPSIAEILNYVDNDTEERILARINEKDPGLAEEIKQRMFMFEDLLGIDDKGMVTLLQEVKREDLLIALKTASDELKEKMFRNMSERVREMIKDDLEVMGPVRLRDVQAAQQTIVDMARRLDSEGKIAIPGKGEDDKFV